MKISKITIPFLLVLSLFLTGCESIKDITDPLDGDNDELGISTYTFFSDIRKVYSETKKASFDIETANNDVTLVLTANTTSNLTPGKYQYDVLMRKQSGELSKIVDGLIYILPTMTEVS